ncbi:MAG: NAD-dependent epimerase/dehydratase family protein [Desulfocapsa sp.]|nr:NAD-dependent epimerase/dehydratase family protein [Desulfocapsa sp.]
MDDTVMVTGASGFIGNRLTDLLSQEKIAFLGISRSDKTNSIPFRSVGDINEKTDWSNVLTNITTVVHLAARAHIMQDHTHNPLASFRKTNVQGTLNLARQATEQGVKRFIFISTIKVHGEQTTNTPFKATDILSPTDPYAISKKEAEEGLIEIGRKTELEIVIIRPPLVYGKGASGNIARLQKIISHGIPLPFKMIHNKRSLIGIDNLCDCIITCLNHPNATKAPLLVSDNNDISTPKFIRLLAQSTTKSAKLLPVPLPLLRFLAKLAGKEQDIKRLTENLQIDCSETMHLLNWIPPVNLKRGFQWSSP